MSDQTEHSGRLTSGELIETRQAGLKRAGTGHATMSGGELFSAQTAIAAAREAAAERKRRLANAQFIGTFATYLPLYNAHTDRIEVSGLEEAKLVQASVFWPYIGKPAYIVGSRPTKNPKFTQLLAVSSWGLPKHESAALSTATVFSADYRQTQARGEALLDVPYSHEQDLELMDVGSGQFGVPRRHQHSTNLRNIDFGTALPGVPLDIYHLVQRFREPNITLATDVSKHGMRYKGTWHKNEQQLDETSLSDLDMETFGVFSGLGDLAVRFGQEAQLHELHQEWLGRHGGELVV